MTLYSAPSQSVAPEGAGSRRDRRHLRQAGQARGAGPAAARQARGFAGRPEGTQPPARRAVRDRHQPRDIAVKRASSASRWWPWSTPTSSPTWSTTIRNVDAIRAVQLYARAAAGARARPPRQRRRRARGRVRRGRRAARAPRAEGRPGSSRRPGRRRLIPATRPRPGGPPSRPAALPPPQPARGRPASARIPRIRGPDGNHRIHGQAAPAYQRRHDGVRNSQNNSDIDAAAEARAQVGPPSDKNAAAEGRVPPPRPPARRCWSRSTPRPTSSPGRNFAAHQRRRPAALGPPTGLRPRAAVRRDRRGGAAVIAKVGERVCARHRRQPRRGLRPQRPHLRAAGLKGGDMTARDARCTSRP